MVGRPASRREQGQLSGTGRQEGGRATSAMEIGKVRAGCPVSQSACLPARNSKTRTAPSAFAARATLVLCGERAGEPEQQTRPESQPQRENGGRAVGMHSSRAEVSRPIELLLTSSSSCTHRRERLKAPPAPLPEIHRRGHPPAARPRRRGTTAYCCESALPEPGPHPYSGEGTPSRSRGPDRGGYRPQ